MSTTMGGRYASSLTVPQSTNETLKLLLKLRKSRSSRLQLHTLLVCCVRPGKHYDIALTSLALGIIMPICEEQTKIPNKTVSAKITN
jgi:hypothetical protein